MGMFRDFISSVQRKEGIGESGGWKESQKVCLGRGNKFPLPF